MLAAATARPNTLLWTTGVLAVAASPSWWVLAGLAGFVLAVVAAVAERPPWVSALGGLTAVVVAMHLPDYGPFGTSAAIVAVAVVPLCLAAVASCSPVVRRRWLAASAALVLAVVGVSLWAGLTSTSSAEALRSGAEEARSALNAAPDETAKVTAARLSSASAQFEEAARQLDGPAATAARFVPVVGQHLAAAKVAATSGVALAGAAVEAAELTEGNGGLVADGRVNLDLLSDYGPIAQRAAEVLAESSDDLAAVDSGWLLPPVAEQLDTLREELASAAPTARTTADVLGISDALLGAKGVRRYLVLATNPSETRELGGFVGGFVLLEVKDGRIEVVRSGKATELNDPLAALGGADVGDADFKNRYGGYRVGDFFQNVTATADMGTNALVARSVFEAATGVGVDGVVVVDPAGLAALLSLTGPVEVPGADRTVTADNVEDFLLSGQYDEFAKNNDGRRDVLVETARAVSDALVARPLPSPASVVDGLSPAVQGGHLMFVPFEPAERKVLDRTTVTGRFGVRPGRDHLSLRGSNANANKIDTYLHRSVDYQVRFDPATGKVRSVATVTLRNDAPSSGRPPIVIGINSNPLGTNTMFLALHSALGLDGVTLDGEPVSRGTQKEFGGYSYRVTVAIPPGGSRTLRFELSGQLPAGETYRLDVSSQPTANPDKYQVQVGDGNRYRVASADGLEVSGDVARGEVPARWLAPVSAVFVDR